MMLFICLYLRLDSSMIIVFSYWVIFDNINFVINTTDIWSMIQNFTRCQMYGRLRFSFVPAWFCLMQIDQYYSPSIPRYLTSLDIKLTATYSSPPIRSSSFLCTMNIIKRLEALESKSKPFIIKAFSDYTKEQMEAEQKKYGKEAKLYNFVTVS